ncbi:MAG: hypothetical protein DDT20_00188 [Firmicutes bacterium]|nr:hypothetical protein [Bacillota bacterium]
MGILLHTCCGPCATYVTKHLKDEGHEVSCYFYNPNIHPYDEYARRLGAARVFASNVGVSLLHDDSYDATEWIREVAGSLPSRCRACYHLRLVKTALRAKAEAYDAFSTTLLISPHQKHADLVAVAQAVAEAVGIQFYYQDFRLHFRETFAPTRELGLYRQNYCGCRLSDYERQTRRKGKK